MIVVGLTGGIASGKTTIANFLKKKKIPVHESDQVIKQLYLKPSQRFLKKLINIGLGSSILGKKINKKVVRDQIFINRNKKKKLEKYLHNEVRKSRETFLKKNEKCKMVFLDIPLLFENKLQKNCDYVILLYAPKYIREKRATKRHQITKSVVKYIMKNQMNDMAKKKKSDFTVNTNTTKKTTYKKLMQIINLIKIKNA